MGFINPRQLIPDSYANHPNVVYNECGESKPTNISFGFIGPHIDTLQIIVTT
jgi:hypothetical protein